MINILSQPIILTLIYYFHFSFIICRFPHYYKKTKIKNNVAFDLIKTYNDKELLYEVEERDTKNFKNKYVSILTASYIFSTLISLSFFVNSLMNVVFIITNNNRFLTSSNNSLFLQGMLVYLSFSVLKNVSSIRLYKDLLKQIDNNYDLEDALNNLNKNNKLDISRKKLNDFEFFYNNNFNSLHCYLHNKGIMNIVRLTVSFDDEDFSKDIENVKISYGNELWGLSPIFSDIDFIKKTKTLYLIETQFFSPKTVENVVSEEDEYEIISAGDFKTNTEQYFEL